MVTDDLRREVYCVLGIPIDAIDMATVLRRIEAAAASQTAYLISTPNLDFLVNSLEDAEFRESLLDSDLCPADGMPVVWIARLIGVPVKQRVSGSDIFEALKSSERTLHRLKVFLFGGAEGVGEAAARILNDLPSGLRCVGAINPGFGTVDMMSRDDMIDRVNSSCADFLAVSLGAKKGQAWLHRNHRRLTIAVRAHLGAAINFQAGLVKRAPPTLRAWGLEWLWRIKEEPHLWRRYQHDGRALLRLAFTRILPLALANRWHRLKSRRWPMDLFIETTYQNHDFVTIGLRGDATDRNIDKAIAYFQERLTETNKVVVIDLDNIRVMDARFFALLLMVRKRLKAQGALLRFMGVSPAVKRMFRLNEVGFLLSSE